MPPLIERNLCEWQYKVYITDILRALGMDMRYKSGLERWVEITEPKKRDTRTGDEIAADLIKRAGLAVK